MHLLSSCFRDLCIPPSGALVVVVAKKAAENEEHLQPIVFEQPRTIHIPWDTQNRNLVASSREPMNRSDGYGAVATVASSRETHRWHRWPSDVRYRIRSESELLMFRGRSGVTHRVESVVDH